MRSTEGDTVNSQERNVVKEAKEKEIYEPKSDLTSWPVEPSRFFGFSEVFYKRNSSYWCSVSFPFFIQENFQAFSRGRQAALAGIRKVPRESWMHIESFKESPQRFNFPPDKSVDGRVSEQHLESRTEKERF